jgi:hypothetical protein
LLIDRQILSGARLSLVLLGTLALAGCPSARDTGFEGGAGGGAGQTATGSGGASGTAGHPAGGAGGQPVTGAGGSGGGAGHPTGGAGGQTTGTGGQQPGGSTGTGGQSTGGASGSGGQSTGGASGAGGQQTGSGGASGSGGQQTGSGGAGGQAGSGGGTSGQGGSLPKFTMLGLIAGGLGGPGNVDGFGIGTRFGYGMCGLVVDPNSGDIFVSDTGNHTIRRIASNGVVTTVAGAPGVPGSANGGSGIARFNSPCGLVIDPSSSPTDLALYVADTGNDTIRHVDVTNGTVSTLAGSPGMPGTTNDTGANARFNHPRALDTVGGYLYVVDSGNDTIRRVNPGTGDVSTLTGIPGMPGFVNSTSGGTAQLNAPNDIMIDALGNIFIADSGNNAIRQLTLPGGGLSTVYSGTTLSGLYGIASDGSSIWATVTAANGAGTLVQVPTAGGAAFVQMQLPSYGILRLDPSATKLYMAGYTDYQIEQINIGAKTNSALAGSMTPANIGVPPLLGVPSVIATDGSSVIYVNDQVSYTVEQITLAGRAVTDFTPTCLGGFLGLANVTSTSVTASCVSGSTMVNLSRSGTSSTPVAGSGSAGRANGTGTAGTFTHPQGLSDDGSGTVFVADTGNNMIRQVVVGSGSNSGVVTTLAGSTSGAPGSGNGTGTGASFNQPVAVAPDGRGNLYVADAGNHLVRKIVIASKVVSTVAGTPGTPGTTDGAGGTALFMGPSGIVADAAGDLYVSDGNTVRKITFSGTDVNVSTVIGVAGTVGVILGSLPAGLNQPAGLAMLSNGSLLITDSTENVVLIAN